MTKTTRIWLVTVLIIIGVLMIAATSYRIIVQRTALAFNRQQLFIAREAAAGIQATIKNIQKTMETAADVMVQYPQADILKPVYSNNQGLIEAVMLVGRNGTIMSSFPYPPRKLSGLHEVLKQEFERARSNDKSFFVSDFATYTYDNADHLSFMLGVAVGSSGTWVCCIPDFAEIKKTFVYPVRSGKTGYAWMIDSRGVLLAHPNKKMEGRRAIDVLKDLWPEYSSFNLETIINSEMVKGEEGKGEYTGWHIGEERKLTKKLIAYRPIYLTGVLWSIGVSAPYNEAMQPLIESIVGPLLFLGFFILTIFVGAFLIAVSERKKNLVNQELTWSQEVFDNIGDGISIIDLDYQVLLVNKAVCEWQGKPASYFKGKKCHEIFQQQADLCIGCPAKETFETGRPAFRERVSTTLGGKKYYFHLSAFPLKDDKGNTVKVAECVKDVTQEMALRSQLLQHERKSMIVKMSAQVAHEIRNPLGTLTLNIDLLEDELNGYAGIDTGEAKNLLDAVKSEIEALHSVLQEYLECTRFPSIKQAKHDINTTIGDLFTLLDEELRRKRIAFKTAFEYNLPPAAIDRDQVRRAFLNLVRNAEEAMPGGGTIEVTTRSAGSCIEVVFEDTGTGIQDDQIDKIFTPFFSTKSGGTGLGLSITQHIITEHKGMIQAESRPGEGTRFTIRLPQWHPEGDKAYRSQYDSLSGGNQL